VSRRRDQAFTRPDRIFATLPIAAIAGAELVEHVVQGGAPERTVLSELARKGGSNMAGKFVVSLVAR
jgi:hypothetical protein